MQMYVHISSAVLINWISNSILRIKYILLRWFSGKTNLDNPICSGTLSSQFAESFAIGNWPVKLAISISIFDPVYVPGLPTGHISWPWLLFNSFGEYSKAGNGASE